MVIVDRLPSEKICYEYASQTMFFPIQAFQTEKMIKPDFDWYFWFSQKAKSLKKAWITKFGFKNAELATLHATSDHHC